MSDNVKVTPDTFSDAILKALADYGNEVFEKTSEIAKSTARGTVSALKSRSAGGKFAKGWTRRAQKQSARGTTQVVYNREYQLVHLQEYPHATGGGGSYPKPGGGNDHTGIIARVEEEYADEYMEEVLSKL